VELQEIHQMMKEENAAPADGSREINNDIMRRDD